MATSFPKTKVQIVRVLSDRTDLSQTKVEKVLDELAALAYAGATEKHGFNLPGFGKLVLVHHKQRKGINPRNKTSIDIPAKVVVKFRVSKVAKDAILSHLS